MFKHLDEPGTRFGIYKGMQNVIAMSFKHRQNIRYGGLGVMNSRGIGGDLKGDIVVLCPLFTLLSLVLRCIWFIVEPAAPQLEYATVSTGASHDHTASFPVSVGVV